ncbi:MAG: DNA methyltransferase [Candidatus Beckwithbacteria bacterium]
MNKPKTYNLTPARGQALLNFQGRIYPKTVELFETELIEEVRQNIKQLSSNKQSELNSDFRNLLIHGDCLSACAYFKSKDIKVDLVYIDPPFASGANYTKKIYLRNNNKDSIQNENATIGEEVMYGDIWQKEDYLNWIYERLLAIRDVMNDTGSIYVHLDWHIGHYVKVLLDEVFGEPNFQNEIIVHYTAVGLKAKSKKFHQNTENIYYYVKERGDNNSYTFNYVYEKLDNSRKGSKHQWNEDLKKAERVRDENGKIIYFDIWENKADNLLNLKDIKLNLNGKSIILKIYDDNGSSFVEVPAIRGSEDTDYNTQKPEEILQRVIKASSNEGMIVADFFVGSGTTAKVAHDLGRKFIGCDIGINAIQTTRDRLVKNKSEFDILKVKDGVRLFRNPAQTTAKIFKLIDGFKTRTELELGEFWDGGIVDDKGEYIPVKFIQIHDRLTKELLDVLLEEIYQLQDVEGTVSKVKVIYAHKDPKIDQFYVNKAIKTAGKTNIAVELVSLDDLLGEKADKLFMPDNADIQVTKIKDCCKVEIKRFFSPYLKAKIDEFNSKKVKKGQIGIDNKNSSNKEIAISNNGLELIESVQFDTTLSKSGVWKSNTSLEDKAGVKEKIKGIYQVPTNKFKMKIRNIAGDEIIIDGNIK